MPAYLLLLKELQRDLTVTPRNRVGIEKMDLVEDQKEIEARRLEQNAGHLNGLSEP